MKMAATTCYRKRLIVLYLFILDAAAYNMPVHELKQVMRDLPVEFIREENITEKLKKRPDWDLIRIHLLYENDWQNIKNNKSLLTIPNLLAILRNQLFG